MDIFTFILVISGVLYYNTLYNIHEQCYDSVERYFKYNNPLEYNKLIFVLSSVFFYFGALLFMYILNAPKTMHVFDTNAILIFTSVISLLHIASIIYLMVKQGFDLSLLYGILYAFAISIGAAYKFLSPVHNPVLKH